ncbi:MAG: transposase, partial [Pseudomonadota bacterium]
MDSSRYYHHLRRWLVGIIILVSVTPLLAISAIAGYQFRTAYRYKVLAHLSQVVDKHRANIDTFLNEKLADIQANNQRLYRAYLLKEALADALDQRTLAAAGDALDDWLAWASRSRLEPFKRTARTIRKYRDGVLAYIESK